MTAAVRNPCRVTLVGLMVIVASIAAVAIVSGDQDQRAGDGSD